MVTVKTLHTLFYFSMAERIYSKLGFQLLCPRLGPQVTNQGLSLMYVNSVDYIYMAGSNFCVQGWVPKSLIKANVYCIHYIYMALSQIKVNSGLT